MANTRYDAIIVGAGLGGLAAACTLAVNGKKVLVIEAQPRVGGYATNFRRGDFLFCASMHNIGPLYENERLHTILNVLGVAKDIRYIPFQDFNRVIFPRHDIVISKGIERFAQQLKELFPRENAGIDGVLKVMGSISDEINEIERRAIDIKHIDKLSPAFSVQFPLIAKYISKTFSALLDEYITSEELKSIVGCAWGMYGLPPEKISSIFYSVPTMQFIAHAGGVVEGTSQRLSDSLAGRIEECGGEILLHTAVTKIVMGSGRVSGVVTAGGQNYLSSIVISNSSISETLCELVGKEYIGDQRLKNVADLDLSLSAHQLYLGLDIDPALLGIKDRSVTVFESYDHGKNYQWIVEGNYDKAFYNCMNYSRCDTTLFPAGKGMLIIFGLDTMSNWENMSGEAYAEKKKEVADILIGRVESLYPGLSRHIEVSELATPRTMRRYTRNPGGAIYGLSQIPGQFGINRRLKTETHIEGLYLAGAYTYPGGGYVSAISSGYAAAQAAQKSKDNENIIRH